MARYIDKAKYFAKIGYIPHPKQWLYHQSNTRFKAPVCGRRFGKSTMAARDLEPELFYPNRMYWIAAPTYDLGEKEFRVVWDDMMIGLGLIRNKDVKKSYNKRQGDMFIEFPWRTRLEVRSSVHPESLVGEGLHGVIMSEAAKHSYDTWERYIRPALADYRGWATFPTTPEGQNWLYSIWQYGRNPKFPDYEAWRFPSWDNPVLYPGGYDDPEIQLLKATTSPEWFAQEIGADFTAFVGKIYGEFEEDIHVQTHQYNPLWENYISFDWGFAHSCAAIEFQVDAWDNIYVWREHYKSYQTLETKLAEMAARDQPKDYKITMTFGDAADPEAAAYVGAHLAPCMAENEAKENWREGVEMVKRFLKLYDTGLYDEWERPISKPKLYISHDCPNLIREFNNYKAQEPPRNARNQSDGRDAAQKKDDHALDALRYGLMHLYKLGAKHHLSEVYQTTGANAGNGGGIFQSTGMNF